MFDPHNLPLAYINSFISNNDYFEKISSEVLGWYNVNCHVNRSAPCTSAIDLDPYDKFILWSNADRWEELINLGYSFKEDAHLFFSPNSEYNWEAEKFVIRHKFPVALARAIPEYVKASQYSNALYNVDIFGRSLHGQTLDTATVLEIISHGFTGTQAIILSQNPQLTSRVQEMKDSGLEEGKFLWLLIEDETIAVSEIITLARHKYYSSITVKQWLNKGLTAQEIINYTKAYGNNDLISFYTANELRNFHANPKTISKLFNATGDSDHRLSVSQIEDGIQHGIKNGIDIKRIAKTLKIPPRAIISRFAEILDEWDKKQ